MKQGISLFSFSENTDVRWMFEHAKKAGYDGVEPVLSESGDPNPQTPEKDVLAMKRMADDMGLRDSQRRGMESVAEQSRF